MWDHIKDLAQFAAVITSLVAMLLFAWWQLNLNRANERETTAKTTYREFLKLAVEYPQLSGGNYETVLEDGNQERYEWFAAYFLWAAEEVFKLGPREALWDRNLQMFANDHSAYFKAPDFRDKEFGNYSAETQALIERAIASGAGSAASGAR